MHDTRVEDIRVDVPGGHLFVRQWTQDAAARPAARAAARLARQRRLWRDFPALLAERLRRRVIAYEQVLQGCGPRRVRSAMHPDGGLVGTQPVVVVDIHDVEALSGSRFAAPLVDATAMATAWPGRRIG